jgi:hypothetical protein
MALRRGEVADSAVVVVVIVPLHEPRAPVSGGLQIGEPLERERWPILNGAEQRLDEWIIIADPACTPSANAVRLARRAA